MEPQAKGWSGVIALTAVWTPTALALGASWVAAPTALVLLLLALSPLVATVLLVRRTRGMRASEQRLNRVLTRLRTTLGDEATTDALGEDSEERLGQNVAELVRRSNQASARIGGLSATIGELRAVIDAGDDIDLVFDSSGTVILANRGANEFFATTPKPLTGRSIEDLFIQTEILDLFAAAAQGRTRRSEVRITRPEGRRIFHALAAPIESSPEDGIEGRKERRVYLSLEDVSDYQSAIQARTDFVASLSHELRTPLASIKGALETMHEAVHDDPAMTLRLVQMIATNTDRLEALTADVLRLSRLEAEETRAEIADVETAPILEALTTLLEPMCAERGLTIAVDVPSELAIIRTDAHLFELILKNLLENASKFAFESTTIRLRAERADGATSRWSVADEGMGIPINQQQRIFERFYQVDAARTGAPKRRGTGLGLAIVKNAVTALEGSIRVESVWKQGTTMIVELPGSVRVAVR
ncbi:MAG TPA: ATP-binding protein [Phycisphaerales bacterium]